MPAPTTLNQASAMLGQPEAPAALSPADKRAWRDVVTSRPASAWTPSDILLLHIYISAFGDVQRLDREIRKFGEVVEGKVSPLVKVRAAREQILVSLGMKLKLMPSNRFDGKTVQRLGDHAAKARTAAAVFDRDDDDLLGGILQ